jgi:hypothetical protein
VLTILVSAWGALIPFVEPMVGYHVTGTPSWHWNAAHTLLAVVPGAVAVVMGFVVLWGAGRTAIGRGQMSLLWAGLITMLCGAWFIVGPTAWPVVTTNGVYFAPAAPLRGLLYQVGYALGTGVILIACAGYVMGWAFRHQGSDTAGVRSTVTSLPTLIHSERVVPRTAAARGPVTTDSARRGPDSPEPLVYRLLKE